MNVSVLLEHDLTSEFCREHNVKTAGTDICAPEQTTSDSDFDLRDKENVIVYKAGTGCVTYHNPGKLKITITDYEKYVNSLPKSWQTGTKRCDFIVNADDGGVFICNELSESHNLDSKEADAMQQLEQTVTRLMNCASIREEIQKHAVKMCIFSNRDKPIASPRGMADAFNVDTFLHLSMSETVYEPVNKFGFKYYRAADITIKKNMVELKR